MTLVYRAPKFMQMPHEDTPGPTSYPSQSKTSPKVKQTLSCFKSKVPRQQLQQKPTKKIGPGSYFLPSQPQPASQHKAVFMSKIERFKTPQDVNQQQQINEFSSEMNSILQCQEKTNKALPGKIITTQQRQQKARQVLPQRLPSIPSQQQSYGYRYDQVTQKLVYNDNPKIIFAQRAPSKEDVYFQRTSSQLGKGAKCWLSSNSKRSSPELKHQVGMPTATQYNVNKINSLEGGLKNGHSTVTSFKDRFQNVKSNKDKLLLVRMKQHFKDYVDDNINTQELKKQKINELINKSSLCPKGANKTKGQFFLTKEQRFKVRKCQPAVCQKKQIQELNKTDNNFGTNKKQPFALGQARFKQSDKQNIGPGSYNQSAKRSNSYSIIQKQQRFKATCSNIQTPGPGSYQTESSLSQKQKIKVPFNHFSCSSLKEHHGTHRMSSMEDMYGKVGKQLNYLSKIQKIGNRLSEISQRAKKESEKKAVGMEKVQMNLKKVVSNLSNNKMTFAEEEKTRTVPKKTQKHQHLYEYSKPQKQQSKIGPGYYQISGSLQKKTFNKSQPPTYQ